MSPKLTRSRIATLQFAAALAFVSAACSVRAAERQLQNPWDVRNEIQLARGVNPSGVKDFFPSFYDYLDIVLFHPTAGYYSSGRVDFAQHYRTFPIALGPSFGQMVAEQMFRMWDGMRKAGTLSATEKFTIAEFGAGNGAMAESVLNYIDEQAARNSDQRWREFMQQTVYASYDRSPALSEMQHQRNEKFGKTRFEARIGDATDPLATIPRGSLKGVILSNELPDCFSVHKVILDPSGTAEIAFTVPSILKAAWPGIAASLPAAVRDSITKDDEAIYNKLFKGTARDRVYLSRATFATILDAFQKSTDYEAGVNQLQFQELYVPASVLPELAEHIRQNARPYAINLTRKNKALVTYINLGAAKFIRGAGAALKAGYVITIDYGSNWDGILAQDFDHLRMFGPGAASLHSDPYHAPTLNDMTTDVNFSHLAVEGKAAGLQALFFGPQHSLQGGTPIQLDEPPSGRGETDAERADYENWAGLFYSWEVYKVIIQQKEKTDAAYRYPGTPEEPLAVSEAGLTAADIKRVTEIEKKLGR